MRLDDLSAPPSHLDIKDPASLYDGRRSVFFCDPRKIDWKQDRVVAVSEFADLWQSLTLYACI